MTTFTCRQIIVLPLFWKDHITIYLANKTKYSTNSSCLHRAVHTLERRKIPLQPRRHTLIKLLFCSFGATLLSPFCKFCKTVNQYFLQSSYLHQPWLQYVTLKHFKFYMWMGCYPVFITTSISSFQIFSNKMIRASISKMYNSLMSNKDSGTIKA